MNTENLTIMFVDIVNYTRTSSKLKREEFDKLHDIFDENIISGVQEYKGKIIKKIGDAFLITFTSPTNALLCGIRLQKNFKETPLTIRVSVHSGEVVIRKNDVYGDAVNVTARIESITKPNDIVFSESVYNVMNKNEITYRYICTKKFKGVKRPLKLFKIVGKKKVVKQNKIATFIYKLVAFLLLMIILIGLGYAYFS
jgi:adenylate cyclase